LLVRVGARIDWLLRFNEFVKRLRQRMTPPYMAQSLIVRNPVDECALRTLAAKTRQRPPDRQCNLLKEIVSLGRIRFITGGETRQRRAKFAQNAVEVLVLCRGSLRAVDASVIEGA